MAFDFSEELRCQLAEATPGLKLTVLKKGRKEISLSWGKAYEYYDLASLTKILFSATALMKLVEDGKLEPKRKLSEYLPWVGTGVRVEEVMTHSSGYNWWRPLYQKLRASDLVGAENWPENWQRTQELLKKEKLRKKEAVYSDLNVWLLGFLMERLYEKPLQQIWSEISDELEIPQVHFNLGNRPKVSRAKYAPTEKCPWRRKILQGEVHDDNTWALGGVAPHAGLFGRMQELEKWALAMRKVWQGKSRFISKKTLQLFTKRQGLGDWGLVFMKPAMRGSLVGDKMSRNAIGHWAFTGPSLWLDFENDTITIILTNRVHPTRNNKKFPALRPKIHDEVYSFLKG